ncbi:hypothetical protein F5879DRAFT_933925 [Lentinula edodes]|nr:hypothetical protein F5879DRAFT_933925 [Lentinula edodes]
MSKASQPELKKFMDKKLFVQLQGGRKVSGTLRGYDLFLNLVIDDAHEESEPGSRHPIGTVVIRGNSVTTMESLEAIPLLPSNKSAICIDQNSSRLCIQSPG